jgi:hypothetical protein
MQSFTDFLVAVITLCLFTQEDLMRFLFNAFDVDDSGAIDEVGHSLIAGEILSVVVSNLKLSVVLFMQTEFRAMLITMSSDDTPFPGTFRKLLEAADA